MRGATLAIAALLAFTSIAGCLARIGSEEGPENRAPRAELTASEEEAWNGDRIEFDARGSHDPDGSIERWEFDFGDGTPRQSVTREEDARMNHSFVRGGEYAVTLTVFDDGDEQGGALTDTASVMVAVNERVPVAQAVLYAPPPGTGNESPTAKFNQTFEVREAADDVEVELVVDNALPVGSSEVTVRLLDANGVQLDERNVTVDGDGNETLELDAATEDAGLYTLEVESTSGGASTRGEIRVLYDEPGGAEASDE